MGEATFGKDAFLAQPVDAAVVICRTEHGNLHSGVLYKTAATSAEVLHLGFEDVLSDKWHWSHLWATPDVDPEKIELVGGLCRLIIADFRITGKFPYGIVFGQSEFALSSGELLLGPDSKGLTCATFALAVFNAMGVQLVDESDWPIRKEDDRQFVQMLRSLVPGPKYFELLKRLEEEVESGCKRIRPQEVVGACSCDLPAKFAPCSAAGEIVAALLSPKETPPASPDGTSSKHAES